MPPELHASFPSAQHLFICGTVIINSMRDGEVDGVDSRDSFEESCTPLLATFLPPFDDCSSVVSELPLKILKINLDGFGVRS